MDTTRLRRILSVMRFRAVWNRKLLGEMPGRVFGGGFVDADVDFLAEVVDFVAFGPASVEVAEECCLVRENFACEPSFERFLHGGRYLVCSTEIQAAALATWFAVVVRLGWVGLGVAVVMEL